MAAQPTLFGCLLKSGILFRGEAIASISISIGRNRERHKTYQVIFFAVNASVNIVERFPTQRAPTRTANEAASVIEISHGLTRFCCPSDFLSARVTDTFKSTLSIDRKRRCFKGKHTEKFPVQLLILKLIFDFFHKGLEFFLGIERIL